MLSRKPRKGLYISLYTFDGSLDEDRLKTAIETAVAAHPALLTRIGVDEHGDPIQTIDDSEKITLGEVEHVTDIRAAIEGFIQPFDIYRDLFFRMRMLRDEEHYYWLLDIHHIIGDGSTLKVLHLAQDAAVCLILISKNVNLALRLSSDLAEVFARLMNRDY